TCFFPITISLFRGLRSVDRDLLRLMQTMGASNWETMRHVLLPASLPQFFSGLRISATYSVMAAVLAEWSGGGEGLGILMLRSKRSFRFDRMFAAVILIIVLSLVFYGVVLLLEKIAMPWQKSLKQKD
ncbi:MAG: ABC transporter permease subunit, partial [Eubacteriales bacterium]|nr:ABC transporter permease subunit [Eubacteriales bacterium]